jgi:hypothetical protein
MSDDQPDTQPAEAEPSATASPSLTAHQRKPDHIYLVPYPKIVFFYPSLLTAVVVAIWMMFTGCYHVGEVGGEAQVVGEAQVGGEVQDGGEVQIVPNNVAVALTWAFLCVLALNLCIVTFDFPRATSLTLVFFIFALVLGGFLLMTFYPDLLPTFAAIVAKVQPVANATFFIVFSCVMMMIYAAVFISVRFNYWEVRPNELLHHHGFLSDLKRYAAPNLRVDKEINDVFEYLLLRSGRLILQPSSERRAIILDNVPFISTKEQAITAMLGALQVQVRERE